MPKSTGTIASTPSSARLRGRPNTSRNSELKNLNQAGTGLARAGSRSSCQRSVGRTAVGAATPAGPASWGSRPLFSVDIETLTGQVDELVLQAPPRRLQPGHRDAGKHEPLTNDL